VHARRRETLEPLAATGANVCTSPRELAAQTDITFVMVSDTPDVEEVLLGEKGFIHGARRGTAVVDMSTISPVATRAMAATLADLGVEMLDAPVSGGEAGAISAGLSIMVGGTPEAFTRVKPLLECLGNNIVHVGGSGAGQVAKACNQIVVALTIEAVAEAFTFAKKNGVDAAKVREALMGGFAGSRILEVHGRRMLENDFTPGFKARLHGKDMRIVMETAGELGLSLPGATLATEHINALVESGDGELDSAAMIKIVEKMNRAGREK
jgi:2-hydroxy-3-oxopropionate reductase